MVELLNDLFERNPWPGGSVRIYKTLTGPFNHVVVETESASLAAYEEQVTKFETNFPEGLRESWAEVADSGGSNELWTLASERRVDQSN